VLTDKERVSAYNKKYRERNKDKMAAYQKIYQAAHKERIREYSKKYEGKNKEKIILSKRNAYHKDKSKTVARNKRSHALQINNIGDSYVTNQLCARQPFKSKDIPQQLIELKRMHIKLKRLIK
jgi:hypothetical protein